MVRAGPCCRERPVKGCVLSGTGGFPQGQHQAQKSEQRSEQNTEDTFHVAEISCGRGHNEQGEEQKEKEAPGRKGKCQKTMGKTGAFQHSAHEHVKDDGSLPYRIFAEQEQQEDDQNVNCCGQEEEYDSEIGRGGRNGAHNMPAQEKRKNERDQEERKCRGSGKRGKGCEDRKPHDKESMMEEQPHCGLSAQLDLFHRLVKG